MNLLLVTCDASPEHRSIFKFDFERNNLSQVKDEAALLIAAIAETGKEFFFFHAETGINGGKDTAETWSNHGHAAIVNLWQYFDEDDQGDITDQAIEYLSEYNPDAVHSLLRML